MGARYLIAEEKVIVEDYPTATRAEMLERIPNRTWEQIGVHARSMGVHRTTHARGNSIQEGRKTLKGAWSYKDNYLFDRLYPTQTREQLLATFPNRTWFAIQSHAEKRNLHRTREAVSREIKIGRKEAKRKR